MDFREVCDFFGGSIFIEEPRGDFADALTRIEDREANAVNTFEDEKAALLLLRLVQAALVGNITGVDGKPSFQTYVQSLYSGGFGERWLFRTRSYMLLLSTWQLYPPLFRFCSLQRGPSNMLINTTLTPHAHQSRLVEQCLERINNFGPLDQLEFCVMREVWTLSHRALEAARVSNPAYIFHSLTPTSPHHHKRIYENCYHRLVQVRDLAEELCFDTISNYAERLIFEVRQAQGISTSVHDLDLLVERYENSGDQVGVGICHVLRADATVSSSFTSPSTFNLLPVDGWDYLGSDTSLEQHPWKPMLSKRSSMEDEMSSDFKSLRVDDGASRVKEHGHEYPETELKPAASHSIVDTSSPLDVVREEPPVHCISSGADGGPESSSAGAGISSVKSDFNTWSGAAKLAMTLYEEANAIFHDVGAIRGQALVASRKACLLLTQEIMPENYWEEKDGTILEDIKRLFKTACALFQASGDVLHVKLTQIHLVLLASQANDDVFEVQHDIGEWGAQGGNWIFARQLGLLAFRFGDHLRFACGFYARARWSYECARHMFLKIPEQWTASFQLEYAMTSLHLCTNDLSAGKLSLEIADIIFTRVANELDEAAEKDPLWKEAKQFFGMMLADLKLWTAQRWENSETMRTSCHKQINLVESYGPSPDEESPEIREWLTEKRELVDTYALITEYEEYIDRGDWETGHAKLTDHLAQMPQTEGAHLEIKLARIDLLLKIQKQEEVHEILRTIDGSELLNEFSVGLAFEYSNCTSLYEHRRSIHALENVLERCINSEFWTGSVHFQGRIEAVSPDHFLFPGNYSHALPWQRALWLGLIEESQGVNDSIYHLFFQSWALFHSEWLSINSFDLRNALVTHRDFDRIATSIARFFLRMNTIDTSLRKVPARAFQDRSVRLVKRWNRLLDMTDWDLQAEALGALERGKALSMAQSLSFDAQASIEDISQWDKTRHRFRVWLDLLSLKRRRTEAENKEYEDLGEASLEQELKAHPLHRMDRRPLSEQVLEYPALLIGLPKDALVVYISLSADGLALYGIDHSGILIAIWQNIVASSTRQMVSRFIGLLARYKDQAPEDVLNVFTWSMSEVFIKPLEDLIRAKSQVIFVPSGDLARFPLGVLLFDGNPLGLQMPVSQVPSLSALSHLSRRSVAGNAVVSAIARPGSVREARAGGPSALPMAGIEALLIGQTFGITPLRASEVSIDLFREEMKRCSIMHLSTHGYFDASAPLFSHISLRENFRVIDLLTVRTKAILVVFSACLSGTGTIDNGDDVLGFPHAVLAAGAHTFLGALWNANDLVTLLQMMYFYMEVVLAEEPITLARLWHRASLMLYVAQPHQIKAMLEGYLKRLDVLEESGSQPDAFVKNGRRKLQKAVDEWISESGSPALNLKHPYFWANFVMIGNANISLRNAEIPA